MSILVCRNKKKKQNPDGWAVVVATDEHYHILWDKRYAEVPEHIRFEVTDMARDSRERPGEPESVIVSLPYRDVWPYIGVQGPAGEAEASDIGYVNSTVDNTGDAYRNFEKNALSLLFSGRTNPGTGTWWNQRVTAYGARCPPEGCPPPTAVSVERTGPILYAPLPGPGVCHALATLGDLIRFTVGGGTAVVNIRVS